ncbi:MAG: T9SS type A sorting domain-containing protein [Bacteroidetes bacterium]|nr:T9SS type A sorting domain-containing protein [Bacteroidota bacterium]
MNTVGKSPIMQRNPYKLGALWLIFGLLLLFPSLKPMAQPTFIGLNSMGGEGFGTIFKTDITGNSYQVLSTLTPNNPGIGSMYGQLCEATNGKMYGVCTNGGPATLDGVLFSYDPIANTYAKHYHFDTLDGNWPYGALIQATNGKLYGTASGGGATGSGVILEFDIANNTYTKKIDFNGITRRIPIGGLMQAPNGKLYGLTSEGGLFNNGVLYEYDYVTNTLTSKKDLSVSTGYTPYGALVTASNGKLYALTVAGGLNGYGTIIEYNYGNNTLSNVHDFDGINGSFPFGSLTLANNGLLYGMTQNGGINGKGVIFEYHYLTYQFVKKIDLDIANGEFPVGSLLKANNSKLYGLTPNGGVYNNGVLFEYNTVNNTYLKLYDFENFEGANPNYSLMQSANGKLYGMTVLGGKANHGTLFAFDIGTSTYTKKIDLGGINGERPSGPMLKAQNGNYYGACSLRGGYNAGVLFEFDYVNNLYTKKIDFSSFNGSDPQGALVETSGGDLYGTTFRGGLNNDGVIYKYNYLTNSYTKLYDFVVDSVGGINGLPFLKSSAGLLFGMTESGGTNTAGIIYEYDYVQNVINKRYDFECVTGCGPSAAMIEAPNGMFYGITQNGGSFGAGVLFEFNPSTNVYTPKFHFDIINGASPRGTLFISPNGKIYGTTEAGGINSMGTLFQYDYGSNSFQKIHDFSGSDGMKPVGNIMQASDGKLYGMTYQGGIVDRGVLYSYQISNNQFQKEMDFMGGLLGRFPTGNLIEVPTLASGIAYTESTKSLIFPNPSKGHFMIKDVDHLFFEVQLIDLMGKVLYQKTIEPRAIKISLPVSIANGNYLIRLRNDRGVQYEKIVLQR